MFTQFIRTIIGALTSVVMKKNNVRIDPTLPHGTPFSFNPASVDIHRAMRDELRPKFYMYEKYNQKVIGYYFSMYFELNSEHYSYYVGVARSEEEFIEQVERLLTTGGEIGEDYAGDVKYAVPGVTYSMGTRLGEAYEREFPESRIPF